MKRSRKIDKAVCVLVRDMLKRNMTNGTLHELLIEGTSFFVSVHKKDQSYFELMARQDKEIKALKLENAQLKVGMRVDPKCDCPRCSQEREFHMGRLGFKRASIGGLTVPGTYVEGEGLGER